MRAWGLIDLKKCVDSFSPVTYVFLVVRIGGGIRQNGSLSTSLSIKNIMVCLEFVGKSVSN